MLIDDVKIKVMAGNGGRGAVAFQKNLMSLGPTGASGGNGGNVYAEGVSSLDALNQFKFKKELKAQNGQDGRSQFKDGKTGEDLVIKVPVGTVIHNLTLRLAPAKKARLVPLERQGKAPDVEITKIGEKVLLAKGGHGGKGNFHFRSPKNTTPKQFQLGLPGESFEFRLELKLIADVGFFGYPNVGKSSLLNELTAAGSKVANYPFTTLEPNLGVYFDLILADIPGLIEGASSGKGLGIKFLRHIERTRVLFHIISSESENPSKDYKTIRKELGAYNADLLRKPEYVLLSKSDMLSPVLLKKKAEKLKKALPKAKVQAFSIYDWDSVEKVKKILNKIAETKKKAVSTP